MEIRSFGSFLLRSFATKTHKYVRIAGFPTVGDVVLKLFRFRMSVNENLSTERKRQIFELKSENDFGKISDNFMAYRMEIEVS